MLEPSLRLLRHVPSRPGEFHAEPLTEPYLNLSIHTARATSRGLPPSTALESARRPAPAKTKRGVHPVVHRTFRAVPSP
jgi:hypothetical protein